MLRHVLEESEKMASLWQLNVRITRPLAQLQTGMLIQAMFQNIRKQVLFVGLNLGLRGVVNDKKSMGMILAAHRIGEVLTLSVQEVDFETG